MWEMRRCGKNLQNTKTKWRTAAILYKCTLTLWHGIWNGLPEELISAESVNMFKNRLDKQTLATQEIKYNWKAKLTGAGIRSLEF